MQQYVLYQLIRWTRYQASFIKGLEGIFLKGSFLCIFSFDCGAGYHRMIPPTIVRIPREFVSSDDTTIVKTCTSCGEFVNDIAPPHFMKWHWIERYIKVVSSQFQNVTLLFCTNEKVFKSFYFPSSFCTDDVCRGEAMKYGCLWFECVTIFHYSSNQHQTSKKIEISQSPKRKSKFV